MVLLPVTNIRQGGLVVGDLASEGTELQPHWLWVARGAAAPSAGTQNKSWKGSTVFPVFAERNCCCSKKSPTRRSEVWRVGA